MDFIDDFKIDVLITQNVFALPLNLPLSMALRRVVAETGLPTISHNHGPKPEIKIRETNTPTVSKIGVHPRRSVVEGNIVLLTTKII